MRPPSPSIPEREFLLKALDQSLRLDGRGLLEVRTPVLTFGPEFGWVECQMGKTRFLASLTATMVKPPPERPFEGTLTIHAELSPMAAAGEYDGGAGRPSEEEIAINRMLDKVLRRSDALDKESLCVLAGQRVWSLRLTLHCLSSAGNILDCACLAGIVALRHFRRSDVEVIGSDVIVHAPTERAPVPLAIHHTPFCLTFAFFLSSPSISKDTSATTSPITILDPTHLEQTLASGTLSIALNAQKEIVVLHKAGGLALETADILRCVQIAVRKAKDYDQLVESALGEDWKVREVLVEVR